MKRFEIEHIPLHPERSLFTLVEHKTSYIFEAYEFNVFETHQRAENVHLVFDDFVFTSMLQGKKVMHLPNRESFNYLPGESVILPPGELMQIDFPEASEENPTQCMALSISREFIQHTLAMLNERSPKEKELGDWDIDATIFHFLNTQELADTISRLVQITKSERGKEKDVMVDLTLREMLVRLMQTQARDLFESNYRLMARHNPLAYVVAHIKQNIAAPLDVNQLARKACMSRANFFKKFKETFGLTPNQYILNERLKKAEELLKDPAVSVTKACFSCGFENLSHFIKAFKQRNSLSPSAYRKTIA